jgi:hypothetical protein
MATAYTSLLGLALPVTGELSGTWGTTVNDAITSLLDSAVAGTTTISTDADITLTTTTGAANESREAILLWTAGGTVTRNITAPAQSKVYIVINKSSSTQSIVLRGVGPTAGVTIIKGEAAVCAWNGTDFIKVSNISGPGTFTDLTVTGNTSLGDADTDTITQVAAYVTGTQLKSAKTATNTLNLAAYDVDGTAYTNLITLTASNTPTLALTSTGVGTINNMSVGVTTPAVATVTTLTATADSSFTSTGALTISKGTTGQRPTPASGMLRFNTTSTEFEGYNGTAWASVGGAALSNDTSTATNVYPLFAAATSGTASTLYTSNAKFLYKPSTGELQASEVIASNGLVLNATTVAASYTIGTGYNAMSVGPVTVASGQSVTVSSGQRWLVF